MEQRKNRWYETALDWIWDGIDIVVPAVVKLVGYLIKALVEAF